MAEVADKVLLALDPSSSCCGYVVFRAAGAALELLEGGVLRPPRAKKGALERGLEIARDVLAVCTEFKPGLVVVEEPAPTVRMARGKDGRAVQRQGQAAYGTAVGQVWAALHLAWSPAEGTELAAVRADVWTGAVPKRLRMQWLAEVLPAYGRVELERLDQGGDMADAICLGRWWWRERQVRGGAGAAVALAE